MDFDYKDCFKYPLSDYKKFLILSLPNLIMSIIFVGFTLWIDSFEDLSPEYLKTIFTVNDSIMILLLMLISFIVTIFLFVLSRGIIIETILKSFNSDQLPDFNISRFFVSGIKYIITYFVYAIIPVLIFMALIAMLLLSNTYMSSATAITLIIVVIGGFALLVVLNIMFYVALGRLAETNSISEACNISNIYHMATYIGKLDIFGIMLVLFIMLLIPSVIGTVFENIHPVGMIISYGIIESYMMLVTARAYSSIYKLKDRPKATYQNNPQVPWGQNPQNMQYPQNPHTQNPNVGYTEDDSILQTKQTESLQKQDNDKSVQDKSLQDNGKSSQSTQDLDFHNLNDDKTDDSANSDEDGNQ